MTQIIGLLIKLCILSSVFGLGLNTSWRDVTHLLRNHSLFLRSLLAMYIATPLIAVLLCEFDPIPLSIKIAILLMAISTGAPLLPKKTLKLGDDHQYVQSLSVIASLFAIITVPLSLTAMGAYYGRQIDFDVGQIAARIVLTVLAPLLVGMVVRSMAGALAERMAQPILSLAGITLLLLGVVIIATGFKAIIGIGVLGIVAIAVMVGASLAVGHALGGPDGTDRTTLAIACATRFPGLGLLIASQNFPGAKPMPVLVTYLLVSNLTALPYQLWRKKAHAGSKT